MTVSEYIVNRLIEYGTTDVFGIPGGVILPLIYAFDNRKDEICPHLSYHEQCAGFAACGYAQSSGKIGVAYATRGPGFTNLITAIADAYYDSLPVLFITAHASHQQLAGMRIYSDQEMNTCAVVEGITKASRRLDNLDTFARDFEDICKIAIGGRKGPVFIDISSKLFTQEISSQVCISSNIEIVNNELPVGNIVESIRKASRPIILIGDGIRQARVSKELVEFVQLSKVPVVSSRFSHDLLCDHSLYYGYVGSHGCRCANFLLSKTDLIISLGNRLHFPPNSESFSSVLEHAKIIRCEIDNSEFNRKIPNTINYTIDVSKLLPELINNDFDYGNHTEWIETCNLIRNRLVQTDVNKAVLSISHILKLIPKDSFIVNDVGNNEFWVSRACVLNKTQNRVLYSKSFGALGSGLPKAIGTYYSTLKHVVCFVGDQGIQMNIQELQFISQHQLPITIVVINNATSGMIRDKEVTRSHFVHTTFDSGFQCPPIRKIAASYEILYKPFDGNELFFQDNESRPLIVEVSIPGSLQLSPNLPRGYQCQDLQPSLDTDLYNFINNL